MNQYQHRLPTVTPAHLILTPAQQHTLDAIRAEAKVRHEKARKAARKAGRLHFPELPYECSWAFETQWLSSYNREARRPFRSKS